MYLNALVQRQELIGKLTKIGVKETVDFMTKGFRNDESSKIYENDPIRKAIYNSDYRVTDPDRILSFNQLKMEWDAQKINAGTLVYSHNEGLENFKPIHELPNLLEELNGTHNAFLILPSSNSLSGIMEYLNNSTSAFNSLILAIESGSLLAEGEERTANEDWEENFNTLLSVINNNTANINTIFESKSATKVKVTAPKIGIDNYMLPQNGEEVLDIFKSLWSSDNHHTIIQSNNNYILKLLARLLVFYLHQPEPFRSREILEEFTQKITGELANANVGLEVLPADNFKITTTITEPGVKNSRKDIKEHFESYLKQMASSPHAVPVGQAVTISPIVIGIASQEEIDYIKSLDIYDENLLGLFEKKRGEIMQLANISISTSELNPALELPIVEENIQSKNALLQSINKEMSQRYRVKVEEWLEELRKINFIGEDIFQLAQHLAQEEITLSDQISAEEIAQLQSLLPQELIVSTPSMCQTSPIPCTVSSNQTSQVYCSQPGFNQIGRGYNKYKKKSKCKNSNMKHKKSKNKKCKKVKLSKNKNVKNRK
jgi:hypothetical protein